MATRPVSPSLTASQRPRVMLWFHTSRCVPASSSRVINGAPQKSPTRAGRSSTTRVAATKGIWYWSKNRLKKRSQVLSWVQPAIPVE